MKLGTALSRFAGGVGGAAASIASKYMDEELAAQRAQTFADIQRESSLRTDRELDSQRNAPERLARDRENARQGVLARASAEREGVVAGQSDAAYQGALDQNTLMDARRRARGEVELIEGTKGAKLTAEQERIKALTPLEIAREKALTDIRTNGQIRVQEAGAASAQRRASIGAKLEEMEQFLGRKLTEDERLTLIGVSKKGGGEDWMVKLASEAAGKALEAQHIKPEEVGAYTAKVMQGFGAIRLVGQVQTGLSQARKDGKLGEAVNELRAAGLSMETITPYLSEAERKQFAQAPASNEPSIGGFIKDRWQNGGEESGQQRTERAARINANAQALLANPNAAPMMIERILAAGKDLLTEENRQQLLQRLGR
jgi:hypothetical protein